MKEYAEMKYPEHHIIRTQIFGKFSFIISSLSYLNHLSGTQSSSLLLSLSSGGPNHSHLDDITEEVSAQPRSLLQHTPLLLCISVDHTRLRGRGQALAPPLALARGTSTNPISTSTCTSTSTSTSTCTSTSLSTSTTARG